MEEAGVLDSRSRIDSQRNILGGHVENLTAIERDCLARAIRHIVGSKDEKERESQCRLLKQETGIVLEYEFEKMGVSFSWYKPEEKRPDVQVESGNDSGKHYIAYCQGNGCRWSYSVYANSYEEAKEMFEAGNWTEIAPKKWLCLSCMNKRIGVKEIVKGELQ